MKQITDKNELRTIQLGILEYLHQFCTKAGIRYSLGFGTMLGAVRHKGYIPWDDDIDLCMPREDYNRFLDLFKDHEQYELKDRSRTKEYYYTFAKVIDNRTYLVEDNMDDFSIGVWVDIFPIDYVPDSSKACKLVFFLKNALYKMRMCKLMKGNPLASRLSYIGYRYFPLSAHTIDKLIHWLICRKTPTQTMCCMTENIRLSKYCFPARVFDKIGTIEFEGKHYCCVNDTDTYLTSLYGNYMQLPPEDKRMTHTFEAYWK